jgi:hypothetical protein
MVKFMYLRTLICQRFEAIEVHDIKTAKLLCKMIPVSCPFARDIKLFDHTLFHIPPLCKLNPLYEQVFNLRLKALSYLAHESGEDSALHY